MALYRAWAIVLRYLYVTRDLTRLTEFLFWPMIDIGFYGLIASAISASTGNTQIISMFIISLVLWQLIYRSNYEICVNVIDEFWEQNISNLISSPLTHWDWVLGMMLSGLIKMSFTLVFGSFLAWLFFGVNIFTLGWYLIPFIILCILSGWISGFFASGLLIYYGPKVQQLPWLTTALVALFSTIYYPLAILPAWMQAISTSIPMMYIFEGVRMLFQFNTIPVSYFAFSFALSLLYLVLALCFFHLMFLKSKEKGLPRMN